MMAKNENNEKGIKVVFFEQELISYAGKHC